MEKGEIPARCLCETYARVTENAALVAARWLGSGDETAAEQDASKVMRQALDELPIRGRIVIGVSESEWLPLGENRGGSKNVTGRDHHPFAFTLWMAGGGVKGGTILGKTDEIGWNVVEEPVHVNDLHATVLHLFGLDHSKLIYHHNGREQRITDGRTARVVKEVLA